MASEDKPTLHSLDRSQSQRIVWLTEELQIPYNLVKHERIKTGKREGRAPDELKKTHPLGKSPQLITRDGRVITESGVIAKYLIETYDKEGKFKGDDKNDSIRDEELTSFSSTNLNANITIEILFGAMAVRTPFLVRPLITSIHSILKKAFLDAEFKADLKYLNDQLGDQDYFMGSSPGRADFMLSWPVDNLIAKKLINAAEYPKLLAWHERCKARDGWKRSIEKGSNYNLSSFG